MTRELPFHMTLLTGAWFKRAGRAPAGKRRCGAEGNRRCGAGHSDKEMRSMKLTTGKTGKRGAALLGMLLLLGAAAGLSGCSKSDIV